VPKFSSFDIKGLAGGALVCRELNGFIWIHSGPKIGYSLFWYHRSAWYYKV